MKRHLTEHFAELADPVLGRAIAPGEGFEVIAGGLAVRWRQTAAPRREDGAWVWQLAQHGGPLRARSVLRADPPHRAGAYHVELSNAGASPLLLEAVYPLVVRFPRIDGPWRTLTARGGTSENFYPPRAYNNFERLVFGGEVRIESHADGRSSNLHLPLMLAAAGAEPDAPGLFCGMEYSGQWFLTLRHVGNAPFLRGLLKIRDLTLQAGEGLALPRVHLGFFSGGLEAGTNALRRYVRECVCPPAAASPRDGETASPQSAAPAFLPPVSYDHWFGIGNDFDEPLMRRQVRRAAELGAEYWVHDAGWFEGGFPGGVGNWHRPDPQKYPRGLKPLADEVRAAGMRFGLWFEIERAEAGTWAAAERPELFFPPRPTWAGNSHHLNLARKDAQDWAIETISRWVERLGLQWIRLDYNIDPAEYFRAADPSGKIQLDYCRGLYRVWDVLRGEHPHLIIENCSSGGRRIDLGTLRRSDTCWISDQSFNPQICRHMLCRLARFLPGQLGNSAVCVRRGAGPAGFGDVDVLSRMCGALSFNGDVASWSARLTRRMRRWVDAYKQIRPLLARDFHQLLPAPTSDRDWDAVQFAAPDGGELVVFAFRMAGEQRRSKLRLRGIQRDAAYVLTNLARPTRPRTVTGADLARRGLAVRLQPHSAACVHLVRR